MAATLGFIIIFAMCLINDDRNRQSRSHFSFLIWPFCYFSLPNIKNKILKSQNQIKNLKILNQKPEIVPSVHELDEKVSIGPPEDK